MIALAKMLARQGPDRLGEKPILNYVLHKTGFGNFRVLDRYYRLGRGSEDLTPTQRRGLARFEVPSSVTGTSAKAALMRGYLEALHRHEEEGGEDNTDIELNLSIPGHMDATELDRLASLARRVPPNGCIVEIGSLFGQSSWVLAKNAPLSMTAYCLDPWVREPGILPLEE